jgi:hypothetical protein
LSPGRPSPPAGDRQELLSPEAYLHTLSRGEPERLPALRPWWLGLAVALLLLAAASFPLWHGAVGELTKLVARALGPGG